jgi:hypothetical protein
MPRSSRKPTPLPSPIHSHVSSYSPRPDPPALPLIHEPGDPHPQDVEEPTPEQALTSTHTSLRQSLIHFLTALGVVLGLLMQMKEAPIQAQLPPGSEVNSGLDPILLHEVTLGLAAGTRGQPLAGESSVTLLYGWI